MVRQVKEISSDQIVEMKNIANDLNINFKHQLQVEKDERSREFIKFKKEQEQAQKSLI